MCRASPEQTSQMSHLMTAVNKIEMLEIIPVSSYTSLRDLITAAQPSIQIAPSCNNNNGSHHDHISIKNPLVKQAALAYLSPRSTLPDVNPNWWENRCCCVDFVNEVVFGVIRRVWINVFGLRRRVVEFEGSRSGRGQRQI
ncbi:hypothetical protein RND81_11G148500 [Saponaria officinalis]|uniref:Uncharacterized protein n=1 Tax=Saponaria officinalis TaxID=3572 RepID=A0AAW1HMC1_SAPOF